MIIYPNGFSDTSKGTKLIQITTSGQVKVGSRYTLTLAELKAVNTSEITIDTLKTNQLLYQMLNGEFQSKPKFMWKSDQFTKLLESDVYNEMWVMRCLPNGKKIKGYICIQLMLLALSTNIAKVQISYAVKCIEVNVSQSATVRLYFSDKYAGQYSSGFTKFLPYTLTFETEIDILNGYDVKDNEISVTEIEWNAFAQGQGILTDEYKEIKNEISVQSSK